MMDQQQLSNALTSVLASDPRLYAAVERKYGDGRGSGYGGRTGSTIDDLEDPYNLSDCPDYL